jgi:hypothetical protein
MFTLFVHVIHTLRRNFIENVNERLLEVGILVTKDNCQDQIDNEDEKHKSDENDGIVNLFEVAESFFAARTAHIKMNYARIFGVVVWRVVAVYTCEIKILATQSRR